MERTLLRAHIFVSNVPRETGPWVYSIYGGRGARKSIFLASSQIVPCPLNRFDIHIQVRFDTKMAVHKSRRSLSAI